MVASSRSLSRIRKELGFLGASARQSAPDSYLAVVLRHPDINDALGLRLFDVSLNMFLQLGLVA